MSSSGSVIMTFPLGEHTHSAAAIEGAERGILALGPITCCAASSAANRLTRQLSDLGYYSKSGQKAH